MKKKISLFDIINAFFMLLLMIVAIYPLLYVIFVSFSNPYDMMRHIGILYKPLGFTIQPYLYVFKNGSVIRGFANSVFIVSVGVVLSMFLTILAAYVLSRKGFLLRNVLMIFIAITMYFSGGLIPFFLTIKGLGMYDSYLALIIPGALSAMNIIILRTAFSTVPDSLSESASIDGARHFTILFRIFVPISIPTLAALVLFFAVGRWNSWFNASIFIRDRNKFPLQLILREMIILSNIRDSVSDLDGVDEHVFGESVKNAVIVVSTLPILLVYPFLQKYFMKGIMIGSIKG